MVEEARIVVPCPTALLDADADAASVAQATKP